MTDVLTSVSSLSAFIAHIQRMGLRYGLLLITNI